MEEDYTLDDRYTEGVWKDMHNGDFAYIREDVTGEQVELINPENGNVYWDMHISEWCESEQHDFVKVQPEAVKDPVNYINRAVRIIQRNDINELSSLPMDFAIGVSYAREQVEINEA
jgi:hypothetical protein